MKTISVNLYSFDELSEDAKENAIENYRQSRHGEIAWSDENRQTLEKFAAIFPITVKNWSYGGRGEGVDFTFDETDKIEELTGQRLATYLWNNYRSKLWKGKYYGCVEVQHIVKHKRVKNPKSFKNGNFFNPYYSAITLDHSCVLTGYCMDDNILSPLYEFMKTPDDRINFHDLLENCFDAWVKSCNDDIDWQNSDEYIQEEIEANEYTFEEDGTMNNG